MAKAFHLLELPKGDRLGIITLSGGEGVMATDACEMNGLRLARLSEQTFQRLKKIFPPWEIPLNPFDGGVCMEFHFSDLFTFFNSLVAIPEDENVDCAIMQMPPNMPDVIYSTQNTSEEEVHSFKERFIQTLVNMKRSDKPFAMWCFSMDIQEHEWVDVLESHSLPVFQSSERAIKALSAMYRYRLRSSLA
ncbi:MAG: hypothetical protein JSV50_08475 [Desulfobacteraceae bacterium]|nr:MAG: hypothetical protein JSV50_08475 [Desulfobacteraceae bacterium]